MPSNKTAPLPGSPARSGSNGRAAHAIEPSAMLAHAERPTPAPTPTPTPDGRNLDSRPARRSTSQPPKRPDRLIAWLTALLCLVVTAVPLSVGLFHSLTPHPLEADALARASETWHQRTELPAMPRSIEPWVPLHHDQPQLLDPPGGTWLRLLTFATFERDGDTDDLLFHTRLTSIALTLLTVLAIFWAGMSIGGLMPAVLSALVAGSLPLLLLFGRLANDQLAATALVTLAVAAALWALRPLRPANHLARQALGWGLAGLLMGLATLTGGLPAAIAVLLPLVLILVLCPNRINHMLGLVATVFIAGLVATPWALHVLEKNPNAWFHWVDTVLPPDEPEHWPAMLQLAGQRLGLLLIATLPWTLWLAAGLMQPFSTSSAGTRTRMFIGWVWFAAGLLLVLIVPGRGTLDELLLVLPPAALVVGQVIRQFRELAAEGRDARIWTWLCWPHALTLLAASLAGPTVMHFQPWLVREGWLDQPFTAPMHPLYWLGMAAALTLLVGLSLRYIIRRYPGKATVCWALWTMLAFSTTIYPTLHSLQMPTGLTFQSVAD